ncbi:MAG: dihydroneopterin aldolase [Muribaculaceae bacterium]|nr:dihydroneopterin aldolase [Muribaculaceae bacterium]
MELITIDIDRLLIHAYHGVLRQEREVGNMFEVSVSLRYPAMEAVETDRLDATLNYAEAVEVIREVMAVPSQLLEHVAGRIRQALCMRFPLIKGGSVKVAKLNPPISAQLGSVSVTIFW